METQSEVVHTTYLSLALTLAKQHMNKWTWQQCCEEAVLLLSKCGINQTSNAKPLYTLTVLFLERISMRPAK